MTNDIPQCGNFVGSSRDSIDEKPYPIGYLVGRVHAYSIDRTKNAKNCQNRGDIMGITTRVSINSRMMFFFNNEKNEMKCKTPDNVSDPT